MLKIFLPSIRNRWYFCASEYALGFRWYRDFSQFWQLCLPNSSAYHSSYSIIYTPYRSKKSRLRRDSQSLSSCNKGQLSGQIPSSVSVSGTTYVYVGWFEGQHIQTIIAVGSVNQCASFCQVSIRCSFGAGEECEAKYPQEQSSSLI